MSATSEDFDAPTIYAVGHGYVSGSDSETYYTTDLMAAREHLASELRSAADTLETWANEHDCDDIPCPTFGDDCPWQGAENIRAEADAVLISDGAEYLTYTGYAGRRTAWWINVAPVDTLVENALAEVMGE